MLFILSVYHVHMLLYSYMQMMSFLKSRTLSMILLVYRKKMHINLASIIYHKYGECKEIQFT